MNKLQRIQQQVAAHMAAKKERELAYAEYVETGLLTIRFRKADDSYNSRQDAAMQLLADVLPLLEAAVEWDYEMIVFEDYVSMEWKSLETEVAKLLEEVEE